MEIIIKNGQIIDGTGKDMYKADIAINDGKIDSIGDINNDSEKVIDGDNLIVTPGFIDIHSHADSLFLLYPEAKSNVLQGVTTVVGGNCGLSPAPLKDYWLMQFWEFDFWHQIEPFIFHENPIQPLNKVKNVLNKRFGLDVDWSSFGDFLNKIEHKGISVNYIPLVGHGQVRTQVMGPDNDREPTEIELKEMKKLVQEAMEHGAHGMSTGLDYPPGAYCNTDEIIKIARKVKEYNGIYSTHWRRAGVRRGTPDKSQKINGILEALQIGRETEIKVQISHLVSGFDIYPAHSSALEKTAARETLKIIDRAVNQGLDVAFDVIPNTSGGIAITPSILTLLKPWVLQAGSVNQFKNNIKASDFRRYLKDFINKGNWYALNPKINPDWAKQIEIIQTSIGEYLNKTIHQIAQLENKASLEVLFEIINADPYTKIKKTPIKDEWVRTFLNHPKAMPCSDTFTFDDKGVFGVSSEVPFYLPHPNTYCAFPRYIKNYGLPRLEDTIKKMTKLPADRFGLSNRGVIKEGAHADIVLFNRESLKTNENYIDSRNYAGGITYVIINGKIVVKNGKHIGKLSGQVIRNKMG